MDKRNPKLRQAMGEIALALPGVFESPQWGGWVYKTVGRDGTKKTSSKAGGAKMLCFIVDGKNHGWHCQFKLPGSAEDGLAADTVKKLKWVEPHPWKTLGPSGWVVARPRTKAQLNKLAELLAESRALLPTYDTSDQTPSGERDEARPRGGSRSSNPVAARMASVMRQAEAEGWSHRDPDASAFED